MGGKSGLICAIRTRCGWKMGIAGILCGFSRDVTTFVLSFPLFCRQVSSVLPRVSGQWEASPPAPQLYPVGPVG